MSPPDFNPIGRSLERRGIPTVLNVEHFRLRMASICPACFITRWAVALVLIFFFAPTGLQAQSNLQSRSTGTDLDLGQFEDRVAPLRRRNTDEDSGSAARRAALIDAFADQYGNPAALETLRSLQRAYRLGDRSNTGCLGEILKLCHSLRLRKELVRYAEFGRTEPLSDKKTAIRAAVTLTDSRKYSSAARYYQKWLRISSNEPESYLSVIVLIEKGRLNYLAKEYKDAERAFRRVLYILNSKVLDEKQKKQILRNAETTYRMMANTFLKTGDFDKAREFFELAGIDSTSPIQFLNEAQIAFATNQLDDADRYVHQFIAKQPNHSESYLLLRKIFLRRNPQDETKADEQFVDDLEKIRRKFETGKVLDDLLVEYNLKLGRTEPAKEILLQHRSETLWRDRANRLLLDIAFREKSLNDLMIAVAIEVDEHDSLVAIRTLLKKNEKMIESWSKSLSGILEKDGRVQEQLAAACLLLHRRDSANFLQQFRKLIERVTVADQLPHMTKNRLLTLLGREAVSRKQYELGLLCFTQCLGLNRSTESDWKDQRSAFDSLLSSVFVHCRLDQPEKAINQLRMAESILRYSPSLMHMKGWTKLQFEDLKGAIVEYQSFLDRFDKSGASQSLSALIERVRLEMAFAFFLMERGDLATEIMNQVLDRNPAGADLDAFQRNNPKYTQKKKLFLEFANGVRNGRPFTLGRN